jgi:DNA repair exonuclease SbcCD ATPase subunit
VGLPDEENSFPATSESSLGGGKDLLYGWLVGRAAADLGLAQALAAGEAQRSEQFRRLEESLLGQIRELQKGYASNHENGTADLDALKIELQRVCESQQQLASDRIHVEQLEAALRGKLDDFERQLKQQGLGGAGNGLGDIKFELKLLADRIARAEYSAQQALAQTSGPNQGVEEIIADRLKSELALLKTQLDAQPDYHTAAATIAQAVQASLQNQLDELRGEVGQGTRAAGELGALRDQLEQLSQRLGQIESAPIVTASLAEQESRWSRELDERVTRQEQLASIGTAELKAQIDALKSRLDESKPSTPREELAIQQLDESVSRHVDELQAKLASALSGIEQCDTEIGGLNGQLSLLRGQLSEVADRTEEFAARTQALESRLIESLGAGEKGAADLRQLQIDMSALLNRMMQLELSYQETQSSTGADAQRVEQVAEELRRELGALKADLGQQASETAQSILASVEAIFGSKIKELQSALVLAQQDGQGREERWNEMQGELRILAQRLVQAESSTQQTHALLVNEAAQSTQLREAVMSEFTALHGQLAEQQAIGASIDRFNRELNARIDNVQDRLGRSIATLEHRDAEIADLKTQVENLSRNGTLKSATPAATVNRLHAPIGVTVGLSGVKTQTDATPPALKSTPAEPNSLLQSYDSGADGSKEERKQLQQRISADIERVRAELRKRAGVSR